MQRDARPGPVAPRDQVMSLLDSDGYFLSDLAPFALHAKPEEVEREIRAQVSRAIQMGIRPTHLDIHMGALTETPELYAVLIKVAREFRVPFMAVNTTDPRFAMMGTHAPALAHAAAHVASRLGFRE